jgi:DNA-directed RNA polymerase I subunit RPA1
LLAEGRNLKGLWDLGDYVDLNVLSSNDIGEIMDTYGVEAGRACIIKEINSIFGMYGITVDMRHLTLVADYMTFGGGYKPFNRLGLDTNVSPFLKMSFEQTCAFLTKATLEGDADRLETPSARLIMGRRIQGGTGSFDVLTRT